MTTYDVPPKTMPHQRFFMSMQNGAGPAFRSWETLRRQPGWVTKLTVIAFILVIAIPLTVLALLAFTVAAVVFLVLYCINALISGVRTAFGQGDSAGRENVKVVRRD